MNSIKHLYQYCAMIIVCFVAVLNIGMVVNAEGDNGFKCVLINNNTEIEIAGYNLNNPDVVIPEKIDNFKVTSIGDKAFNGCKNVTSIKIPNTVTKIGNYAFINCKSLKSITISAKVTKIGYGLFGNCDSLESVSVDSGNKVYDSRGTCNAIIKTENNKLIDGFAKTIIPDSVVSIGKYAFKSCSNLNSIVIPESVTGIGTKAFYGCNITAVTLPESVKSIGDNAFDKKVEYTVVEGSYADKWAISHDYIIVSHPKAVGKYMTVSDIKANLLVTSDEKSYPTVEYVCPTNKKIKNLSIPDFVTVDKTKYWITSINNNAFLECNSLVNITIPASVTGVGSQLFLNCPKLESIKVDPNSNTFFNVTNCNALIDKQSNTLIEGCYKTVIPQDISNIGNSAFQYRTKLKSINIPAGINSIGRLAFNNCSLSCVSLPASVNYIGEGAFDKNVKLIVVPGSYAEKWAKDNGYTVIMCVGSMITDSDTSAKYIITSDAPSDLTVEYAGLKNKNAKTITIPATVVVSDLEYKVTSISDNALKGKKKIKKVTIGMNVSAIGNNSFKNCKNLKTIVIRSTSLSGIGKNAFNGINKKAVFKIPKLKYKKYKRLFNKKSGYKKSMIIKKIKK